MCSDRAEKINPVKIRSLASDPFASDPFASDPVLPSAERSWT